MSQSTEKIFARPGMYLPLNDGQVDAACMLHGFLYGVLRQPTMLVPTRVEFCSADFQFTVSAYGDTLTIPATASISLLFSAFALDHPLRQHSKLGQQALRYLRPIVWFSQFCVVEICAEQRCYRQAFLHGNPISDLIESTIMLAGSSLSFSFTLSDKLSEQTALRVDRLQDALDTWQQEGALSALKRVDKSSIRLDMRWSKHSTYRYLVSMWPIAPST